MPRKKTFELPNELAKAYPDGLEPERIGNNLLKHTCPIPEYPGSVTTAMSFSAIDFNNWWEKAGDGQKDDDKRHWAIFEWETRFHFIKAWEFKDVEITNDIIKADPIDVPDMRIVNWFVVVTQPLVSFSVSLPNSPGPLTDDTSN